MNSIINDRPKFKLLRVNLRSLRERQLQRLLRSLKNEGFFNDDVFKSVYSTDFKPATMCDLPKVHKDI